MSLSKYFKDSSSFQPEKIVKSHVQDTEGWKTSVEKQPSAPFKPEKEVKRTDYEDNTLDKDPGSAHLTEELPSLSTSTSPDSEQITDKETGNNAGPSPDLKEYIKLSEVEKQLEKARQDGVREGLEKAEEDYGSTTKAFVSLCQQLDSVRETIISNSSREIEDFALAIAEKIIRSSLRDNDTTIIATIEEALQRAVKSDEFTIYINPGDYDTVMEKSSDLISGLSGLSNIVIKQDSTVEKGGAKIESDNCTIDATIAGQFDLILDEVKKR